MSTVEANALVVLDYELRDEEGELLDSSAAQGGEPIVYVHGYGMVVPGLEAGLAGLSAGDEKEIVVTPEGGFGERDEDLVVLLDRDEVPRPETVAPGDELVAESPDGDEVLMRVLEVTADTVTLDANHPLAGHTVRYAVHIREIRPATEEELEEAARAFEEAGYGDADSRRDGLVQIRAPKREKADS